MRSPSQAKFPALETVTCPAVSTQAAAYYLCRAPKTLQNWASNSTGPIRPVRINGRLAWPVSEIRRAHGLQQEAQQ
jgi:hypothetical protein